MFRIWCKIWHENHLIKDLVVENDESGLNRTRKIFKSLDEACYKLDLPKPIWLDSNIEEFKRHDKTRFLQDSFIENIPFDFFEIHIIEED